MQNEIRLKRWYLVKPLYFPFVLLFDVIGYFLFSIPRLFTQHLKNEKVRKILVLQLTHIGDIVVTTPVFKALKKQYPDAEIVALVRPLTKNLLENNPHVDRILTLEAPWFNRSEGASWMDTIKFARMLSKEKFSIALEFHGDPRDNLLLWLIGAKQRVGYGARGGGFFLTKIVPYHRVVKHITGRYIDVLQAVGIDPESRQTDLFPDFEDKRAVTKARQKLGLKPRDKIIVIHPGSGRPNKFWPNERFAKVADKLAAKRGVKVVLSGGPGESELIKSITARMEHEAFVLSPLTLRQLAEFLKGAKLLISTDTGPMHMARAMGTPTVSLFGPVDPREWGYNDKKSIAIFHKLPCSPCELYDCPIPDKYACLKKIKVSEVLKVAEKMLKVK